MKRHSFWVCQWADVDVCIRDCMISRRLAVFCSNSSRRRSFTNISARCCCCDTFGATAEAAGCCTSGFWAPTSSRSTASVLTLTAAPTLFAGGFVDGVGFSADFERCNAVCGAVAPYILYFACMALDGTPWWGWCWCWLARCVASDRLLLRVDAAVGAGRGVPLPPWPFRIPTLKLRPPALFAPSPCFTSWEVFAAPVDVA
jgi:hypothetical protein